MQTSILYLREKDKRHLLALLSDYLADVDVWVYGSRINGAAHEGSDLDLVLRSKKLTSIPNAILQRFLFALRDSNLPILVDARDWVSLPVAFQAEILKKYYILK